MNQQTRSRPKKSDREQSRLFIEKACELGADKVDAADALMGALHRMPHQPHEKSKPKRRPKG